MHLAEGSLVVFRVWKECADVVSREAKGLTAQAAAEKTDSVQVLLTAAADITASTDKAWGLFLGNLEEQGGPSRLAAQSAMLVGVVVKSMREMLAVLRQHSPGRTVELTRIAETIDRIDRESLAVGQAAARRPLLDPDRLRQGVEEAKRREGEDLGELVSRLQSGKEG